MRLISAFGLVDQMVDRMLFYPFFGAEVRKPMEVTSKAGWAPLPAGYQRLLYEFPEKLSLAVDKSSWDWSMPAWVIKVYFDAKMRQCINPDWEWAYMVAHRFMTLYGPGARFVMPDGLVWRQKNVGIMKSGSLLTLSMNSAAQYFQHALAWLRMGNLTDPPRIWTMGDDTLTLMSDEDIEAYSKHLAKTGCLLKICERSRDFSGFLVEGDAISNAKVTPLYQEKHKFMIKHVKPEQEERVMMAFTLLYALNPPDWLKDILKRTNVQMGPKQKLWAKGMINLKMIDFVPSCFRY
nr:RNA-dependent RNA polymerase [Solemoviridae sp.]